MSYAPALPPTLEHERVGKRRPISACPTNSSLRRLAAREATCHRTGKFGV